MNTINAMREVGTSWENIAYTLQAERDKLQHLLDGAQADYEDAMRALVKTQDKVDVLEARECK